jgi:hypothetical protein
VKPPVKTASRRKTARSLHEEPHRRVVREIQRMKRFQGRQGQWIDRKFLLTPDTNRGATGCEDLEGRTRREKLRNTIGNGSQDMLTVVEDEQQLSVVERGDQPFGQGSIPALSDPEGPGHGRQNEARITQGSEVNKDRTIIELPGDVAEDGECQARLADATRASEGQERRRRIEQQRLSGRELHLPTDELGAGNRRGSEKPR